MFLEECVMKCLYGLADVIFLSFSGGTQETQAAQYNSSVNYC